jgi:hypothetical protein
MEITNMITKRIIKEIMADMAGTGAFNSWKRADMGMKGRS